MDTISIRYGESLVMPIDTGDTSVISADIYIGKPGEVYTLTQNIAITNGTGTFSFNPASTEIPLGVYNYQINLTDNNGHIVKLPSPVDGCDTCDTDFPKFIVAEALDEQEVS